MSLNKQIVLHVVLLAAVFAIFEFLDIDIPLQDRFYDARTHRWIIDRKEPVARWTLYLGLKGVAVAIGVACGAVFFLSYRLPRLARFRRPCLLQALSLVFVPLIVAGSKQFTNVYTPAQVQRYGGDKPYVKVMERYPAGFQSKTRGKGFPAGHATGGFALMMLYFAFSRRRWKVAGLVTGLTLGWIMGLYQMLNGQHYLSHTIVTMSASWIVILIICRLVAAVAEARGAPKPRSSAARST